ncbi:clotting factor G beta subunit-like isoform X2 [Dermacentor albipictus]
MKASAQIFLTLPALFTPQVLLERINQPGCGTAKHLGRIVNGKEVDRTHMPWIVYLLTVYVDRPGHFKSELCGGSIISPSFILTAAHCVIGGVRRPRSVHVKYNATRAYEGPRALVKKVVVHPLFDMTTLQSDVALLELSQPLRFGRFVKPVCLPTRKIRLTNKKVFAAGWGHVSDDHVRTDRLHYIKTTVLTFWDCPRSFNNSGHEFDSSEIFCTETNGKGTCRGDSGGPLTLWVNGRHGHRHVLVGLMSFSFRCSRPGSSNVHTRISHFLLWIKKVMKI